ncbi:hypothetical protein PC122_g8518 [Phytophthora cactorum]|nr:hypothetical protein PC122_g8518 [Phytophthora cactorum]
MAEWSLTGSSKADPSSMVETFLENLSMSALSVLSYRLEWEHQGLDFQSLLLVDSLPAPRLLSQRLEELEYLQGSGYH